MYLVTLIKADHALVIFLQPINEHLPPRHALHCASQQRVSGKQNALATPFQRFEVARVGDAVGFDVAKETQRRGLMKNTKTDCYQSFSSEN